MKHQWRCIAQYEVTSQDAHRLVAGDDLRPPTELYAGEHPPLEDPRPFLGLHNLLRDTLVVACWACEVSYTPEVDALPCPGDPDAYRPDGSPIWWKLGQDMPPEIAARQIAVYEHLLEQGPSEPGNVSAIVGSAPRPGRNAPCPCGSGLKFKKCCGKD